MLMLVRRELTVCSILLHVAITNIFHPFIMDPMNEKLNAASLESPKAVLRASINQLQRLIVISRLYHPHAHSLSVLSSAVVHVSNTIIRDAALQNQPLQPETFPAVHHTDQVNADNPNWHFYFLVCLAACQDLGACFPVFEPVGKGLLAMAMRDGSMSAAEANRLMRALEGHRPREVETFGSFVLDFGLEATKQGGGQVKDLAAQFEEFSMHNEFTEGGDFVVDMSDETL